MKTFLGALLISCCGLAAAADWESPERLRAAVRDFALAGAPANTDAQVTLDERLQLPRCQGALRTYAVGRGTVGVACGGPQNWKLFVPVRLAGYGEVLVLSRPLGRGDTLQRDDLRSERRDLGALSYGYFHDVSRVVGQQVRRALPAGSVLLPSDLQVPLAVHRGQQVTLLGRAGFVEVRVQGEALADGAVAERVKVRNAESKTVVEGVIRGPGLVEVGA